MSRFSRDVAHGINDFRTLACGPQVRLFSIREPYVFHYLPDALPMKYGVVEWWPPFTMAALTNVLLQANQERSILADRTKRGREEIINSTSDILTPLGKNGSGQRSLCHVHTFHREFTAKLLRCPSPWGEPMKQLVEAVNAWVPTLPQRVLDYLGPKSTATVKALATIKAKINVLWMQAGSPEDIDAWIESQLSPEILQKGESIIKGIPQKRQKPSKLKRAG